MPAVLGFAIITTRWRRRLGSWGARPFDASKVMGTRTLVSSPSGQKATMLTNLGSCCFPANGGWIASGWTVDERGAETKMAQQIHSRCFW